jgi:hypothetical protein
MARPYLGENADPAELNRYTLELANRSPTDPTWGSAGRGANFGAEGATGADSEFVVIDGVPHVRLGDAWQGFASAGLSVLDHPIHGKVTPDVQGYLTQQNLQKEKNAKKFDIGRAGVFGTAAMFGPVAMASQLGGLSGIASSFGAPAGMTGAEIAAGGVGNALAAGGAGVLPDSYWSMTADASGAVPGGAGGLPGMPQAFPPTPTFDPSQFPGFTGVGEGFSLGPAGLPFASPPVGATVDAAGRAIAGTGAGAAGGASFLSGLFSPSSLISAAGNLGSAAINAGAASKASGILQDSAAGSNALLKTIYDQNRADLEPWRTSGVNALTRLSSLTKPGSQMSELEMDPGYNFRLSEGLKSIEKSAAARGLLQSGGTLKGVNRYAQDYASGEYGNVVNRLLAQAGLGQTATNAGVQANQNYGNQAANNMQSAGNARASGYVGASNAFSQGIGNTLNSYMQNQILNRLIPGGV